LFARLRLSVSSDLGLQYAARQGFRTVAVNCGRDKEALARSLGRRLYRQRRRRPGPGCHGDGRGRSAVGLQTEAETVRPGIHGALIVLRSESR
jgi:hypothetical protein